MAPTIAGTVEVCTLVEALATSVVARIVANDDEIAEDDCVDPVGAVHEVGTCSQLVLVVEEFGDGAATYIAGEAEAARFLQIDAFEEMVAEIIVPEEILDVADCIVAIDTGTL